MSIILILSLSLLFSLAFVLTFKYLTSLNEKIKILEHDLSSQEAQNKLLKYAIEDDKLPSESILTGFYNFTANHPGTIIFVSSSVVGFLCYSYMPDNSLTVIKDFFKVTNDKISKLESSSQVTLERLRGVDAVSRDMQEKSLPNISEGLNSLNEVVVTNFGNLQSESTAQVQNLVGLSSETKTNFSLVFESLNPILEKIDFIINNFGGNGSDHSYVSSTGRADGFNDRLDALNQSSILDGSTSLEASPGVGNLIAVAVDTAGNAANEVVASLPPETLSLLQDIIS